jgi:hypothetical protein
MPHYRNEKPKRVRKAKVMMISSYEQAKRLFLDCTTKDVGASVGNYHGQYRVLMKPFDDRVYITVRNWTGDPLRRTIYNTLAVIYPSDDVELCPAFFTDRPHDLGTSGNVLPIQTVYRGGDRLDDGIFIFKNWIHTCTGWGYNTGWNHSAGRLYKIHSGFVFNLETRDVVETVRYDPPYGVNYHDSKYKRTYEQVRTKTEMPKNKEAWKDFLAKRRAAVKMIEVYKQMGTFDGPLLPYKPLKGSSLQERGVYYHRHHPNQPSVVIAQCLALEGVFNAVALETIRAVGPLKFIGSLKKPSVELLSELNIYEGTPTK